MIQMYQYLCDVRTTKLLNTPIHLGSQDVVKAKYRFKEMKGVSSHLLPSYLDERMWHDRWGNCGKQAFGNILEHIAEQNLHLQFKTFHNRTILMLSSLFVILLIVVYCDVLLI